MRGAKLALFLGPILLVLVCGLVFIGSTKDGDFKLTGCEVDQEEAYEAGLSRGMAYAVCYLELEVPSEMLDSCAEFLEESANMLEAQDGWLL